MHNDWQQLKPWIKQLKGLRWQLAVGLGLAIATALFGVGLLSLSGWFITAAALYSAFDIYTPGAGIRFFAITRTVSRYLERVVNHDLVLKLQARWRVALFKRLIGQSMARLAPLRVADGVQNLTRNLDAMDNLLLRLIAPAVTFLLASLVVAVLWLIYIPLAAVLLLLTVVAALGVSWFMARITRRLAVQQLLSTQRLRRQSMAVSESITELLAWDAYDDHQRQLLKQAHRQEQLADQQLAAQHRASSLVELLSHAMLLVVVTVSGLAFEAETLSSAELIMLVLSALAWQELASELPAQWASYGDTVAAADRLLEDSEPEPHPVPSQALAQRDDPAALRLDTVSVARSERVLIKPISVTFYPRAVHWLCGPSGLGKSSLAEAIMGWLPLASGHITRTRNFPVDEAVGLLTQKTEVLDASVKDNLNPAQRSLRDEALWGVLRLVELDRVIKNLPQSLNTVVGARGVLLSGGQLRRLALARVLLQERPILLLDEPFAGLERELAKRVLENSVSAYPNTTWIVISHVGPEQLGWPQVPLGKKIQLQPS